MADGRLRERLRAGKILLAPGAYDMISAKLIEEVGFEAVYMTGNGQCASALGLPDAGLLTLMEMVERVHHTVNSVRVPVICDADTGFGGILNVRRTIQEFEWAGASAIQLEDQVDPKKCGHTLGREVIPAEEMARKLQAAAEARRSDDLLLIARSDARTGRGLEEAIRRGKLYGRAGADVIFIEAPESEEEFRRIAGEMEKPVLANMVESGRSPFLSPGRLQELGFAIAIYPGSAFLAAAFAVREVLQALKRDGTTAAVRDRMMSLEEYHRMIGFPKIWEIEERYGLKDYSALEARFGKRS